jgi:hypothetical protein
MIYLRSRTKYTDEHGARSPNTYHHSRLRIEGRLDVKNVVMNDSQFSGRIAMSGHYPQNLSFIIIQTYGYKYIQKGGGGVTKIA